MKEDKEEPKITVWELLRRRYPAHQYALLSEVSDAAGFHRTGSCDYISIGLWNSRGLDVAGIELKSYRNDWLREMKNPAKAESFFKYCDRWYLLITEEGIAKPEEIPLTWGLLQIKGKKIIQVKQAPTLSPQPIDRSFLAALLKRATQGLIHKSEIQDLRDESYRQGTESRDRESDTNKRNYNKLCEEVSSFETAAGFKINTRYPHSPEKIGAAVKYVLENEGTDFRKKIEKVKTDAQDVIAKIDEILK